MSTHDGALLRVCDLKTHFELRRAAHAGSAGRRRAVDGVSLGIAGGSTLGLVGESGCGKTTLARSVLRLIDATSGRVYFDGVDVLGASGSQLRRVRRDMQLVAQDPFGSLNPRMPIGRIIAEPLDVHHVLPRRRRQGRVAELLTMVGLPPSSADRYPHEFSGGQRQRIAIARAIALTPKLVICDEPTSALDVSVQSQILNLLADLREKLGMSYLFISHDLAVVRHVSDRVAVMYLGKIVEIADVSDLYCHPRHPYTMELLAAASWGPQPHAPTTCMTSEAPDAADPPSGCAFHPRCPFAVEECRLVAPALRPMVDRPLGHLAACHRADESLSC